MTQEELDAVLTDHELWLGEKGGKCANLYGAKLDFADLTGAILCGANLNGTNLHRAKMRNADLNGASLNGANLYGADLTRANLCGVGFYDAILTRAKLDGADLTDASFQGAEIEGGRKVIQLLRRAMRSDGQELFLWQGMDGFYIKSGQMILPIEEAAPFWEETRGGTPLGDECLDIVDMFKKAIARELRVVTGRASDLSGLWIAAVLLDNTVMTIGYEETKEAALAWGQKAMEARAWEGENKDPPDYYERKKQ